MFFNKLEKTIEQDVEYVEGWATKIGYSLIKIFVAPIVRWIWVKEVSGSHNLPLKGSCIIAANHESYFDFICFIAATKRKIHYLAAEKFFKSPIWRPIMKITGQIKVERDSHDKTHTHRLVTSALKQERMIGIFPEGTRAPDEKMLRAYTGVAQFALKTKTPVIPVGLHGTREIMSRDDKKPKFKKIAKIKIGQPLHLTEYHDREHTPELYREVTDLIMLEIAKLADKKYPHVETPHLKNHPHASE